MAAIQLDIGEQYRRALRTKSYQDMLEQVQEQLRALGNENAAENDNDSSVGRKDEPTTAEDNPSDARRAFHLNLAKDFLFPKFHVQGRLRGLLREFLERGLKASELCYQLLESIAGARANNGAVRRIVDQRGDGANLWGLARISRLENPLSQPKLAYFIRHHGDRYAAMVPRLRSLHNCFVGFGRAARRRRSFDEAARGAYGVRCEFDTVGRQLARLNDEIEHERRVARTLLRGGGVFSPFKEEVTRELREGEARVLDQLQELEERVHLCLLTIARARKHLTQGLLSAHTAKNTEAEEHCMADDAMERQVQISWQKLIL